MFDKILSASLDLREFWFEIIPISVKYVNRNSHNSQKHEDLLLKLVRIRARSKAI